MPFRSNIFGLLIAFICLIADAGSSLGATTRWYEFKGLYVNMPATEAKKLGLDKCTKGQVYAETCERGPNDKTFGSIGGAKIKSIAVVIDRGKVNLIHVEVIGAFWDELITAMKSRYGAPKKETRTSVLWDKGDAEYIEAYVLKGVASVDFAYSEFDSEKKIQERAKKAVKDF